MFLANSKLEKSSMSYCMYICGVCKCSVIEMIRNWNQSLCSCLWALRCFQVSSVYVDLMLWFTPTVLLSVRTMNKHTKKVMINLMWPLGLAPSPTTCWTLVKHLAAENQRLPFRSRLRWTQSYKESSFSTTSADANIALSARCVRGQLFSSPSCKIENKATSTYCRWTKTVLIMCNWWFMSNNMTVWKWA